MYIGYYYRASREEQQHDFKTQQKLVQREIDETGRIRTIIYFADGTSQDLSDQETKMIFDTALKGKIISKSKKRERPMTMQDILRGGD